MTEAELWKVRGLIAEARAAGAERHLEFTKAFADLMVEMRDFWFSVAPEGTELPPALAERVKDFSEKWQ